MSLDISSNVQALSALGVSASVTAGNIANSSTESYSPMRTEFADGPGGQGVQVAAISTAEGAGAGNGVDLAHEMVGLMQIERAYSANATVISSMDQTTGTVLNMIA